MASNRRTHTMGAPIYRAIFMVLFKPPGAEKKINVDHDLIYKLIS